MKHHDIELEKHLKKAMGHKSPAPVCGHCKYFVAVVYGCSVNGLSGSYCDLSPAAVVYTDKDSTCKHFDRKNA